MDNADEAMIYRPLDNPLFKVGRWASSARMNDEKDIWPVVLLSHGTGGSADGLGWLGERLARKGFVAIGVSHHGNTAMEPYLAEGFACWWERPRDLSFVLGANLDGLMGRLDHSNVFAAGFSLGGYTVISMLGAVTEASRFLAWAEREMESRGPREFPDLADRVPRLFDASAVFRESWARQSDSYRDPRVKAACVLAPAPTVRGFTPDSLKAITTPVRIIVGRNDAEAPHQLCAKWLHDHLPRSRIEFLGEQVGHYVFLPVATEAGTARAPDICVDAPDVNRSAIHDMTAAIAIELFRSLLD